MKILPIMGEYNTTSYISSIKVKNNYNKNANITDLNALNKNYNQINFRCISKESLEWVQKIPLEERIAAIYEHCSEGDLILTGKDIHKAKLGMLQSLGQIDRAIKKIFFIPDKKVQGYLGFMKDEDSHQILNLNDFDIKVATEYAGENLKDINIKTVAPYDSYYVTDGSEVWIYGNKKMNFRTSPQANLGTWIKNYASAKDFSSVVNAQLEKINRKTVSQLSKEVKEDKSKVTFKDVGGQDELITELKKSVIYPLRYPEAYENFELNKGFVLYGPPGTGKLILQKL